MRLIQLAGISTFILLFINTARAGQPATPVLEFGVVPIGWLGYPLGTYLTIEGQREEGDGPKMGRGRLLVDTINGKKLDKPAAIGIDHLKTLPGGVRCVIKGYENMRMIGAPPASEQAAKEAGKPFIPPQAGWQAQCYFVALSVVAPKNLKISKGYEEANVEGDRPVKAHTPPPIRVSEFSMRPTVGLLGKPLGTRLVIEGRQAEQVMMANPLAITKVNDRPLSEPVTLELSEIEQIASGVTYKLEGYESGSFSGPPDWAAPGAQQPFQYHPTFVVVRVVAKGQAGK